ncbi:MAG: LolA family protein [Thermodesulfobacteriota bacterium]
MFKGLSRFSMILLCVNLCCLPLMSATSAANQTNNNQLDKDSVLSEIENRMQDIKTLSAEFKQTKQLSAFDRNLVIKGKMYLKKPHKLAWHVSSPSPYRMVIRENTLYQWDKASGETQTLSLDENPAFTAVAKQMQMWFSGNYKDLLQDYEMEIKEKDPVRLSFSPRAQTMARDLIRRIVITFDKNREYIQQIRIMEKNKDQTNINFSNIEINPSIDSSAWEVEGAEE